MSRACNADSHSDAVRNCADVIRRAGADDLPGIVEIHQKSFSNFFLTRLGSDFLHRYYKLVLEYRGGIVLVSERQNVLQGFACGFVDPVGFYRGMWCTKLSFTAPVLSALVRQPSLMKEVLYGVRRIHNTAAVWPEASCELSSIAVVPERAGNGLGKALVESFLAETRSLDARSVYLTTDAEGNDAVNAFYRSLGFRQTNRFVHGRRRWMNEYAIDACDDRIESCGTL